jgi:hypothetical protein
VEMSTNQTRFLCQREVCCVTGLGKSSKLFGAFPEQLSPSTRWRVKCTKVVPPCIDLVHGLGGPGWEPYCRQIVGVFVQFERQLFPDSDGAF